MRNRKKLLTTVLLVVILATTTVLATAASADPSQGTTPAAAASTQGHPDSWFTGQNNAGQDSAKAANFPQKILDKLSIARDYFQQLRTSGMSVKDILIAGVIAKAAKAPMADIVAAKQGGKTWQQIAADNHVNLKNLRHQVNGWMHRGGKGYRGGKNGQNGANGKNGKGPNLTPARRIAQMQQRVDRENRQMTELTQHITDLTNQAAAQTDATKKQGLEEKAKIAGLQKNVLQAQLDRDNYILQVMREHQNDNTNTNNNTNG